MIIEIFGAGFHNQGAELMLRTVLHELRNRLPGFKPALDVVYDPNGELNQMGVVRLFPPRYSLGDGFRTRFRKQKLLPALSRDSIDAYGELETIAACQGFIDISGFLHTDQWVSASMTQNFAVLTHFYRMRKRPVILLPQAFGPFRTPALRRSFKQVLRNCDLVYARDRESFGFISELETDPEKFHLAPDITLFHPTPQSPRKPTGDPYVCIVPNARMLDKGADMWGDTYEKYIRQICCSLLAQNIRLRLVAHESTGEDEEIIKRLHAVLDSSRVEIVTGFGALQLKEIVWNSLFVVGSRYHSLVAAFSGSVPSVCLGWSHKYNALYEDFGCSELLVQPQQQLEEVLGIVTNLTQPSENMGYRSAISSRLEAFRVVNQQMWERVIQTLTRSGQQSASILSKAISILE